MSRVHVFVVADAIYEKATGERPEFGERQEIQERINDAVERALAQIEIDGWRQDGNYKISTLARDYQ